MRASSTVSQPEAFTGGDSARSENYSEITRSKFSAATSYTTEQFNAPNFDASIEAATSRLAGRLNAAQVSRKEFDDLVRERKLLLDKKFEGRATSKDLNRLAYVRWSLDRIEDAQYGQELDELEGHVAAYERYLSQLEHLNKEIATHNVGKRR